MTYTAEHDKLRKQREKQGLSRFGLSKKAGMGGSALYRIESGVTPSVHHLSAAAIAHALNCEIEDIFTPIDKRS